MSIFNEVVDAISMKDVIEYYTNSSFTKHGSLWWINCPFHNDKHPSFSLKRNEKFGMCQTGTCGWHGDVINFVASYHNLKNYEACLKIIEDFHLPIDIPNHNKKFKSIDKSKYLINKQQQLKNTEFCEKVYTKWSQIFKRSYWFIETDKSLNKFTLDFQFILYLRNFTDLFCKYFESLKYDELDKKLKICKIMENLVSLSWYSFMLYIPENMISEGFINKKIEKSFNKFILKK